MIVRGCALDSGTLTTDTEIVRMSHCGGFVYGDRYVQIYNIFLNLMLDNFSIKILFFVNEK